METKPKVFLYGATGYTGRLVALELKRRGIPFTIGGRNKEKLIVLHKELGEEGIEVKVVNHDFKELSDALAGYEVVINTTGPFSLLGEIVVKGALYQNAHYIDTTGEQEFMLLIKNRYDKEAQEKKRVVINGNAWEYAMGECASQILYETYPELDSYKIIYSARGKPSIGTLQSALRVLTHFGFQYLSGNLKKIHKVSWIDFFIPGETVIRNGVLIPGGEVVHFASNPGVKNVQVFYGPVNRSMIRFMKIWRGIGNIFGKSLDPLTDWAVRTFWKTPPPEDSDATRFAVISAGESENNRKICLIYGSRPYATTAFLCGLSTELLLAKRYKRTGVISIAQAFSPREILEALKEIRVSYRIIE